MVWAVGLGAWDRHIGHSLIPSFGLSRLHERHAVGGWRGGRTARPDQTDTTKPTGSGLCMSPSHGVDGEKFCLRIGAHHPPSSAPDPCHQPDLKPASSPTQPATEQVFLSHSFTRQVTVKDLDIWIHMKNVSSGFKSRFHSDVVQCKRVKKPCYLHIYIRVYRKCLYKWGRWPAYTLGTPHPRDATGQIGRIPLSLSLSKVSSPNQSG